RTGVAPGEAPRAARENADAEAVRLALRYALAAAALDRDRLVPAADHAYVRVRGAELRGGVQGAVGQVSHVRGRERTRGPDQRVLSIGEAARRPCLHSLREREIHHARGA